MDEKLCVCVKCGPPWRNSKETVAEVAEISLFGESWVALWMALCPRCGSKRCSGAIDHDNACTVYRVMLVIP